MNRSQTPAAFFLGIFIALGLAAVGYQLADGLIRFKQLDRTVNVKGLAEREVPADIAIWPIRFSEAGNDLGELYQVIEQKNRLVSDFLLAQGFAATEISAAAPAMVDRQALSYVDASRAEFRFTSRSTITVYSIEVARVREAMGRLVDLGKQGLAIAGEDEGSRADFLFTGLNSLKPAMIEEATRNAREVAEKFARDSDSRLGKIKTASQGLFTIQDRDANTPHIKRVRVVSTVEYYLTD